MDIKHIYYYLCGNEHTCNDLKKNNLRYLKVHLKEFLSYYTIMNSTSDIIDELDGIKNNICKKVNQSITIEDILQKNIQNGSVLDSKVINIYARHQINLKIN